MARSSGYANAAKRMLSYLLVVLLVIALPLSILSNSILRTLFSPDDISEPVVSLLLLRGGVRDQLMHNLISDVWADGQPGEEAGVLKYLTAQDRFKITQILFPKDWVRDQVHENLNNLIAWIESDESLPQLTIDLSPLQENLFGGGSYRIIEIVVESWPKCSALQERQLDRAIQPDSAARFEYCQPDGDLYQRLIDHVDQRLQQFIEKSPAEVPLFEGWIPEEGISSFEAFRQSTLRLMLVFNVLKPLPFLFLGIIMTLVIRSSRDLGRWWGIPLGISALFTLFLVIIAHGIGPGILKDSMIQSEQVLEIQETIVDAVWDLLAKILNRSASQAFFTGMIGLVFFLLSRRSKKTFPEPPPTPVDDDPTVKKAEDIPPPPQVETFDPDSLESSSREDSTP